MKHVKHSMWILNFFVLIVSLHVMHENVILSSNNKPVVPNKKVPYVLDPTLVTTEYARKYKQVYNPEKMTTGQALNKYIQPLSENYANLPPEVLPSLTLNVIENKSGNPTLVARLFGQSKIYSPKDVQAYLKPDLIFLDKIFANPASKIIDLNLDPFVQDLQNKPILNAGSEIARTPLFDKVPPIILQRYAQLVLAENNNRLQTPAQIAHYKQSWPEEYSDGGLKREPTDAEQLYKIMQNLQKINTDFAQFAKTEKIQDQPNLQLNNPVPVAIDNNNSGAGLVMQPHADNQQLHQQLQPDVAPNYNPVVNLAAVAPQAPPLPKKYNPLSIPKVDEQAAGNYTKILTAMNIQEPSLQGPSTVAQGLSLFGLKKIDPALKTKIKNNLAADKKLIMNAYQYDANPEQAFINLSKDIEALAVVENNANGVSKENYQAVLDTAQAAQRAMAIDITDNKFKLLTSQDVPSKGVSVEIALGNYQRALAEIKEGQGVQKQLNQLYKKAYTDAIAVLQKVITLKNEITTEITQEGFADLANAPTQTIEQKIDNLAIAADEHPEIIRLQLAKQLIDIDRGRAEHLVQIENNATHITQRIWLNYLNDLSNAKNFQTQSTLKKLIDDVLDQFKNDLIDQNGKNLTEAQNKALNVFLKYYKDLNLPIDLSDRANKYQYDRQFNVLQSSLKPYQNLVDICIQYQEVLASLNTDIRNLTNTKTVANESADTLIKNHKITSFTVGWIQDKIKELEQAEFLKLDSRDIEKAQNEFNHNYFGEKYAEMENIIRFPSGITNNKELLYFYRNIAAKYQEQSALSLAYQAVMKALSGWSDNNTTTAAATGNTLVAVAGGIVRLPFAGVEVFDATVAYVDKAVLQSMGLDLNAKNYRQLKMAISLTIIIPALQQLQTLQSNSQLTSEEKKQASQDIMEAIVEKSIDYASKYQLGVGVADIKTGDTHAIGSLMALNAVTQLLTPDSQGIYSIDSGHQNSQYMQDINTITNKYTAIANKRAIKKSGTTKASSINSTTKTSQYSNRY